MSVKFIPLHTQLLYNETGVCRGIPIFFYFCSKIYIVGEAVLTCTHNVCSVRKY